MKYTTHYFLTDLKESVKKKRLNNVVNIISNFHYKNISPPNLTYHNCHGEFYTYSDKQCYDLDDAFFSALPEINQLMKFLIQLDTNTFESMLLQSFLEKLNSLNIYKDVYIIDTLCKKYPHSDIAYSIAATKYSGLISHAFSALKINSNLANHIILFKKMKPLNLTFGVPSEILIEIANSDHINRSFMISHLIIAACIPFRCSTDKDYIKNTNKIIDCYNESLKIESSCYAYIMKLKVLDDLKDYDSIINTSIEALHLYKNVYVLYNFIAKAYYETQNYEESIAWCKKIKQNVVDSNEIPCYYYWSLKKILEIAYNALKHGDYEKSLMYYRKYCPIKESIDLQDYCKAILLAHNSNSFSTEDILINKLQQYNTGKFKKYFGYSIFNFGKHKGKQLDSLIIEDAQYISWCVINLDHFYISFELFFNENMKKIDNYYKALKVNILKSEIDAGERSIVVEDYEYDRSDYYDWQGDWGGLYGEEAFIGYWNTE